MDAAAGHSEALDYLRSVVAQIEETAWDGSTNCGSWTVRQLASHAINSQLLWIGSVRGEKLVSVGTVMKAEPVEGDVVTKLDETMKLARETWSAPGVLEASFAGPFGEQTGADAIVYPTIDAAAHGWDLAVSCGLGSEMPVSLLSAVEAAISVGVNDMTLGAELFGAPAEVSNDASDTDKLMATTGRSRN